MDRAGNLLSILPDRPIDSGRIDLAGRKPSDASLLKGSIEFEKRGRPEFLHEFGKFWVGVVFTGLSWSTSD